MTLLILDAKMMGTLIVAPAILMLGLAMSNLKQPEFGRLVQEIRECSGLTQTELATKIRGVVLLG
jgi:hypothetical protein